MRRRGLTENANLAALIFPDLVPILAKENETSIAGAAEVEKMTQALLSEGGLLHDETLKDSFERAQKAFDLAAEVAKLNEAEPVLPEDFAAAGLSFDRLEKLSEENPELLPVVAPYGLSADSWTKTFTTLTKNSVSLDLAKDVKEEFQLLNIAPEGDWPVIKRGNLAWTLRLIPAGEDPPIKGFNHGHETHATLSEMLMLDLLFVEAGKTPVDSRTFTWIDGPLNNGKLGARHVFDSAQASVMINCREVQNQGSYMGARPPVF